MMRFRLTTLALSFSIAAALTPAGAENFKKTPAFRAPALGASAAPAKLGQLPLRVDLRSPSLKIDGAPAAFALGARFDLPGAPASPRLGVLPGSILPAAGPGAPIAAPALDGLTRAGKALAEAGASLDVQAGKLDGLFDASGARAVPASLSGARRTGSGRPSGGRRAKTPELGVDKSAMDLSVRPQDDFFRYVNGTWLKTFKMPADKARFGVFDQLHEKSQKQIKTIIQGTALKQNSRGTSEQQIADLYKSFMDVKTVEARGLAPIAEDLAAIDRLEDKAQLVRLFGRVQRDGVDAPLGFYVDQDSKDPSSYIVNVGQSGLGLPDREYYFKDDARSAAIQGKYVDYLAKMFGLAGERDARRKAEAVYALEKELARHQWTVVENRDAEKTYNKLAIQDLKSEGADWAAFLAAAGVPARETHVIVAQPSYLEGLARVMSEQPLEAWKLYMKARSLESAAGYLPDAFVKASFEFHGRVLNGQPKMRSRWKRGVSLVNGALGELIGQLYVKKHFPESSKQRLQIMVENLRAAFHSRIQNLPWMGEETKKKAIEKLVKFTAKIGYPEKWKDYSGLEVRADDLMGNVRRSSRLEHARMMDKLGQPVDRGEWHMTPQTVNAYYNAVMNDIVFPAAILQGAFFNPDADDAVNYGAIGGVIGHEMSHGFDDQGAGYDGEGVLKDWWTPQDRAQFEARTDRLVSQFDAFEPLPGQRVNGRLTLGENIGDLGGVLAALDAYRLSLGGAEAPVIDGFTGEQRFFLGWAQVWRSTSRDEALAVQLATDPHSPEVYRVNGVMPNVPDFYRAFQLRPGDGLYLPEDERAGIW